MKNTQSNDFERNAREITTRLVDGLTEQVDLFLKECLRSWGVEIEGLDKFTVDLRQKTPNLQVNYSLDNVLHDIVISQEIAFTHGGNTAEKTVYYKEVFDGDTER